MLTLMPSEFFESLVQDGGPQRLVFFESVTSDVFYGIRKSYNSDVCCPIREILHAPVELHFRNKELNIKLSTPSIYFVHDRVPRLYFIAAFGAIALLTLSESPTRDLHADSVYTYVLRVPTAPPVYGVGRFLSSPRILFHPVWELYFPEYYMSSLLLALPSTLTRNKDFTFSE